MKNYKSFKKLENILFPDFTGVNVNMMPIIMGENDSVPYFLKQYLPLINKCGFYNGTTVYLTIRESFINKGKTQSRPGIHTDSTCLLGWGAWGGLKTGIYLASTDGRCRIWNELNFNVDHLGALKIQPKGEGEICNPNTLYWITDKTPHESLPSLLSNNRQFFRLVSEHIGAWYSKHSTANPLGIVPKCRIIDEDKFCVILQPATSK